MWGSKFFPKGEKTDCWQTEVEVGKLKLVLAANNKKSVSGKFQPLFVTGSCKVMGQ